MTTTEHRESLVSVVVPVYNREHYVRETLDSILAQTYSSFEIVAVNDGSTDGSLSVLRSYAERHPSVVRVIDQRNQGQVAARNNAIAVANGDLIAFLDSDDLWLPEKLERQVPLFVGDVGLVYCAVCNIDDVGEMIDVTPCESDVRGHAYHRLLTSNKMTGGTVVVSRAALEQVGVFDPSLTAAENWDLWIRVSRHFSLDFVDEPLVKYRKHAGNMSKDNSLMMAAIEQILSKHCDGGARTPELETACREARATYEYRRGVYHFGRQEYETARGFFRNALQLRPGFRDSRARLLRTYLGTSGNRLLSTLRTLVSS